MRAFIFSLDAFVAFTLALIAIYSLIYFSTVPSAYYYILTQAHYLSRDTLMALSTAECLGGSCYNPDGSVLDNIAFDTDLARQKNLITDTVGLMVPNQFGYAVSVSDDGGQTWSVPYNTSAEAGDSHAKDVRKLTLSTQVMAFSYSAGIK